MAARRPGSGLHGRTALLAACLLACVAAPVASAHTGEVNTVVSAGPYRLVVRAAPVPAGSRAALAFRLTVADGSTGAPEGGARVTIAAVGRSGVVHGPYVAPGVGGIYSLLMPIADPSNWRTLHFEITVSGGLGVAKGVYVPPSLFDRWLFEPWVLLFAAVAAGLFVQGFVRLRRRGRRDHASWGRLVLFAAGLAAVVLPLVSPLDVVGDHYLLSAHMLQHVLIGDVAPALLLLAVRGPLLLFAVPAAVLRLLAGAGPLRKAACILVRPGVALAAWAVAYGGWHIPAAYDWATRDQTVHDFEHASFVAAGLLIWFVLIDPARRGHLSPTRRLGVAAAVFGMGTIISDVLIFSREPLYPAYASQPERVFSLSPLLDQQLAGLVMTVDQILTLGTCAAFLIWPLLRERRRQSTVLTRREQPA